MLAASEAVRNGQERAETDTGGQGKFSEGRRSDRPERRRALRPGEMVNDFRDKVNWREYYAKIAQDEYNPDFFEDGETAIVELSGGTAIVEMQRNGEWQVIRYGGIYDERRTQGRDGVSEISEERNYDGSRSGEAFREPGRTDSRNAGKGSTGLSSERNREGGAARDSETSGDGLRVDDLSEMPEEARSLEVNDGQRFSREQHEIRYPQYTEAEIKNNSVELQRMKPVVEISGTEIDEMEGKLDDRVLRLFAQRENNVFSEQFGDVSIKKSSIRSEHRHGGTDGKVRSYPAIPDVIKNGVVIDSFEKHPGVERIVVAAPIIMGEQKYYMGVMLQRSIDSQRLYAHDVVIEKEPTGIFEDDLSTTGSPKRGELHITDILLNALNVKRKFSRDTDSERQQLC